MDAAARRGKNRAGDTRAGAGGRQGLTSGGTAAPPLVIRVAAQQEEAVQAAAQEEAPRILIYHTHTYEAYEITETETYTPTEKWAHARRAV